MASCEQPTSLRGKELTMLTRPLLQSMLFISLIGTALLGLYTPAPAILADGRPTTSVLASNPTARPNRARGHQLAQGPVAAPDLPSLRQRQVRIPTMQLLATTRIPTPTIDLKLLVISADGTEASIPAIQQSLDYLGATYTVWIATQHPNELIA